MPFIGYDFGSATGCVNVILCADRHVAAGAAVGHLGRTTGVEEEITYGKEFFGSAPNLSSSVLTAMSNALVLRNFAGWRPYGVGGIGLMVTRIQFTESSLYTTDRKSVAWNAGGGVMTLFTPRFGVDVDVRYVRAFREVSLSGFTVGDSKMGFARASAALVVQF